MEFSLTKSHSFFLVLSEDLFVKDFSTTLLKIIPNLCANEHIEKYFGLHKPVLPWKIEILSMFEAQLVAIKSFDVPSLILGGSFQKIPGIGFVFIGFPQLNSIDQLKQLGISLSDFLSHDPINYYIGTIQLKESMVKDLQVITQRLEVQKADLENLVARRTKELLHSEKMASLGTLAAGVAHEINNPMGYILSNLDTLNGYINHIRPVIDAVLNQHNNLTPDENQARIDWDELEFIQSDISSLIKETITGGNKVANIVTGLKSFSHPSDRAKERVSLREIIDTAVNITHNEIKHIATLSVELPDDVILMGNASELSQVFVNLLINASHAITNNGVIKIACHSDSQNVVIKVTDNGCGIPADTLRHLFEPFFTTKKIGQGTGLGLSISLGIIENHEGSIHVESEVGIGTTFIIRLPTSNCI